METLLNMSLGQLGTAGIIICAIILSCIQVAPIKVYPLTAIKNYFIWHKKIAEKIDNLATEVENLKMTQDEDRARTSRTRILRFGDEIFHHVDHTKEHFEQMLLDIAIYDRYCEQHPEFENTVTKVTSERIVEVYKELLKTNGFLSYC